MQNKRIAHFIETDVPGGAESLLLQICKHIQSTGNTPLVLHNGNDYFVEQCQRLGIEEMVPTGLNYFKSTKTLPLFTVKFAQFLKQQKIDILHSHLFGPVTGAAVAAKLAGVAHIGTLHDVYMIEEKPSRIRLLQLAGFVGTRLITVSKTMENFYRQSAFFKSSHINTIYNGVKCNGPEVSSVRPGFAIADDEVLLINVGRLVPLKRHDLLLSAISRLPSDKPWRLLIVGDGPEKQTIEAKIQQLKLQDRVVLAGHRNDIGDLLGSADIFVQCSDTEGLSMSIMEAMAAGLPAVVTDVGGNSELIHDQQNGLLVPANDSDALYDALNTLLLDAGSRKAMQVSTHDKVNKYFNINMTYKNYMDQYQEMIG